MKIRYIFLGWGRWELGAHKLKYSRYIGITSDTWRVTVGPCRFMIGVG